MKRVIFYLLILLSSISMISCVDNNNNKEDNNGNTNLDEYKALSYTYEFKSNDLNKSGGEANLNNLNWKYEEATYLGYDANKGIQIGSKNNPEASYIIKTDITEDVIITDYSINASMASNGESSFKISFDNYTKEHLINDTNPKDYTELELKENTKTFKLEFIAKSKAMYLKSISFSLLVSKDSKLDFNDVHNEDIPEVDDIPKGTYKVITKEEYYKDFDLTLKEDALREELIDNNSVKTKYSYGDSRYILQYTDKSIKHETSLYGLYDGEFLDPKWQNGTTWNREHVWACSHMEYDNIERPDNNDKNHMTDLHNLRAATNTVNSSRNNKYFNNFTSDDYYFPNETAKENDDFRGDVARILFYMYATYDFLNLCDNPDPNSTDTMGDLSILIEWNILDPVDEFEISRNDRIYEYQGNRNPFIDYPELVSQLFYA